jgi:hypothetical protein
MNVNLRFSFRRYFGLDPIGSKDGLGILLALANIVVHAAIPGLSGADTSTTMRA